MANTFPANGNVGIGTAGPQAQLDVRGAGDSLLLISDTTNGNRLLIGTDDQIPRFIRLRPQSGGGLAITNDGDVIGLFVRASDGNVGIGTTEPRAALDVKGGLAVGSEIRLEFFDLSVGSTLVDILIRLRRLEQQANT
jgi:hypothetical protein